MNNIQLPELRTVDIWNAPNVVLYDACKAGDISAVESIMNNATNWNSGLRGAGLSGNMTLIELMILKGANDYNGAFRGACKNGHRAVVELMISKGANVFNEGLILACGRSADLTIVNRLLQMGATALEDGLKAAIWCRQGDKAVRLIHYGAIFSPEYLPPIRCDEENRLQFFYDAAGKYQRAEVLLSRRREY